MYCVDALTVLIRFAKNVAIRWYATRAPLCLMKTSFKQSKCCDPQQRDLTRWCITKKPWQCWCLLFCIHIAISSFSSKYPGSNSLNFHKIINISSHSFNPFDHTHFHFAGTTQRKTESNAKIQPDCRPWGCWWWGDYSVVMCCCEGYGFQPV